MIQSQTAPALLRARASADAFAAQVTATLNVIDSFADAPAPTPDDSLRSFEAFKAATSGGRP